MDPSELSGNAVPNSQESTVQQPPEFDPPTVTMQPPSSKEENQMTSTHSDDGEPIGNTLSSAQEPTPTTKPLEFKKPKVIEHSTSSEDEAPIASIVTVDGKPTDSPLASLHEPTIQLPESSKLKAMKHHVSLEQQVEEEASKTMTVQDGEPFETKESTSTTVPPPPEEESSVQAQKAASPVAMLIRQFEERSEDERRSPGTPSLGASSTESETYGGALESPDQSILEGDPSTQGSSKEETVSSSESLSPESVSNVETSTIANSQSGEAQANPNKDSESVESSSTTGESSVTESRESDENQLTHAFVTYNGHETNSEMALSIAVPVRHSPSGMKIFPKSLIGVGIFVPCAVIISVAIIVVVAVLVVLNNLPGEMGGETSTSPSKNPSSIPTSGPHASPSGLPSGLPTSEPSLVPTQAPSGPIQATYFPGLLTVQENSIYLSQGLTSRVIGTSGTKVQYANGKNSTINVHAKPDYGTVFQDTSPENEGGWIYVSNSEVRVRGEAGVGAFTFNRDGNVIDYRMILTGTKSNCGGGKTPWGTYISCEEADGGQNYQVDPTGVRSSEVITLGSDGGRFESFAYDLTALPDGLPQFFVTEDQEQGALQRFRPHNVSWDDPWRILHGNGTTDFLVLESRKGTFYWTENRQLAKSNAGNVYPNSEGIDVVNGTLYFVSKKKKMLYILDLHEKTFTNHSTDHGAFDAQPDQIARLVQSDDLLFFTEDGRNRPGIHARNKNGAFFTIIEGLDVSSDETTGLAFSPDGKHLYFAMQDAGLIFDITRTDSLPFYAKALNIKYHNDNAV